MADFVISIVTKVAEYLVEPLIREGKYFFCVNNFIREIDNEKNELVSERDYLIDRVKQVKQNAEEIEKPVEKWLSDVESLLKEVDDLDQQMKDNKNCFQGRFPTWKQYRICKQMINKKEAMGKLKGKSYTFQPFSHPAPLPDFQHVPSENFTYFESTKKATDQLLEALQDEKTYKIGVYGMGGSGKTTLVTELRKKVEGMKMFDKAILITISQNVNIRAIQEQIANALNLKLNEENEEHRAERLWLILKQKGRLLIILDDLWSEFNLTSIGIKSYNESMGAWKIILTTRNQHICDLMDCEKKIHMGLLHEGESWKLFQKHAKIDDKFSESLNGVPIQLCRECKGLPIAIKVVGSSLKGKSKASWKKAFRSFNHPHSIEDQVEGVGSAFKCLKLSYDNLGDEKVKALFLMCSIFPEDYEISIEDIIRYAIGLGLGDMVSLESSRDDIKDNIDKLLKTCLLMHVEERKKHVKMHDMVRDTALWIAKRFENKNILVNIGIPFSNMVEDDGVLHCFAIASWDQMGDQFSHSLHAPNLKILLIKGSVDLSHATFEGIEGLQILSIMNDKYHVESLSLPLSIQLLTNLRTLRLNNWELGNISFISNLTKLEILDLRKCSFNELPNDLGNLKGLKLLDVSYCHFVQSDNYNGAIGRCSQLEELYLSMLKPTSYYSLCVENIITLPKLERFDCRSSMSYYDYHLKSSRILHVPNFDKLKLPTSKRNILQLAETVHFEDDSGGFNNVFPDMVKLVGGMKCLKCLHLTNCSMIEHIFDLPSDSEVYLLIPKLVELVLENVQSLKELIRGTALQALCFFVKLETLNIRDCHQLHNIFPWECNLQNLTIIQIINCKFGESLFSVCNAQSMHQLEELLLENCDELKHVIANAGEKVSNSQVESIVAFPKHSSQFTMPRLKKLVIRSCKNLVSVFPICSFEEQTLLEEISIQGAPSLKHVFGECDHQHHSSHQFQNQNTHPDLYHLRLYNLESLIGICPENNCGKWPSSKRLTVGQCPKLSASLITAMTSSKIENLDLNDFSELSLISKVGPTPSHILNLQCLRNLAVGRCENLKSLLSMEMHKSLPELNYIRIYDCSQLEQIVLESEELVKLSNAEVYFPKLTYITIISCDKMKSLFSVAMARMLPKLSVLTILNAVELEEVFKHGNGNNTHTDTEIVLPNLQKITLNNLPSFVDICKDVKFKVPKLLPPDVSSCPKIVPNFGGIQNTPPPKKSKSEIEEVPTKETHRDYDLDLS